MSLQSITLEQMLRARDARVERQQALLRAHGLPLVSFTLNIAGPVKDGALVRFVFRAGLSGLEGALGTPSVRELTWAPTGPEALLLFPGHDARALKAACMALESEDPVGRLYDLDVLDTDGQKLSRDGGRTCLVCGGPVSVCARSRAHGLPAIIARTQALERDFAARTLGRAARQALEDEAAFTPKPGLVDRANNGAHRDMDLALFQRSAAALEGPLTEFAALGLAGAPEEALRRAGRAAEETMFAATGGVNTHKGAIYSFALLLGALGAALAEEVEPGVYETAARWAAAAAAPEGTHGAEARARWGCGGVRAEAVSGFAGLRRMVPVLEAEGPLTALLTAMATLEDSTVYHRGGPEGAAYVRRQAQALLSRPREARAEGARALDRELIRRNLSPGGSADLLALALFVQRVKPLCDAGML